jgi:hypothetical protein
MREIIGIALAEFVGDTIPNSVFHGILAGDSADYDWAFTAGAGSISFIRFAQACKPSL